MLHVHVPVSPNHGARDLRQLMLRPILNLNAITRGSLQINTGRWSGYDKLDTMISGKHGKGIGADLVSSIAVPDYAIRPHDYGGDVLFMLHAGKECAGHGIGDESGWDFLKHQLESSKSRALVVGTRFGAEGVVEVVHSVEAADYTESSAMSGCCEGSEVLA